MEKDRFTLKDILRFFASKITNRERGRARAYQRKLDKIEKKKPS